MNYRVYNNSILPQSRIQARSNYQNPPSLYGCYGPLAQTQLNKLNQTIAYYWLFIICKLFILEDQLHKWLKDNYSRVGCFSLCISVRLCT